MLITCARALDIHIFSFFFLNNNFCFHFLVSRVRSMLVLRWWHTRTSPYHIKNCIIHTICSVSPFIFTFIFISFAWFLCVRRLLMLFNVENGQKKGNNNIGASARTLFAICVLCKYVGSSVCCIRFRFRWFRFSCVCLSVRLCVRVRVFCIFSARIVCFFFAFFAFNLLFRL